MSWPDDDALSWEGDEDLRSSASQEKSRSWRRGRRKVGRGSEDVLSADPAADAEIEAPEPEADAEAEPEPMGNAALIGVGVLAGIYTLYAVGWALGSFRLRDVQTAGGGVADVMFQAAMWLGILSPVIWFFVTMHVTRRAPRWQRFVGLAIGIVLLVPWPFVMMGAIGR
ncbi:DNA polymerase III subunit gamma/tau [Microbacterium sp. JZ31]|uniref:DNA polymerase III subunit gamma/tau n=1 Tax=Microbacterium sp. JZ31 TaxID=1906274 RepID=UPI001934352F|nr:DNA polymerase III subunit gamma/tau [Microbacterium sp. JZ31]